jgi:hypothetical protein
MKVTIVCKDRSTEHEIPDVSSILYSGKIGSINAAYNLIEAALNLDRTKFEYYIDIINNVVKVYTSYSIFMGNLRSDKLANLLDIELG